MSKGHCLENKSSTDQSWSTYSKINAIQVSPALENITQKYTSLLLAWVGTKDIFEVEFY